MGDTAVDPPIRRTVVACIYDAAPTRNRSARCSASASAVREQVPRAKPSMASLVNELGYGAALESARPQVSTTGRGSWRGNALRFKVR